MSTNKRTADEPTTSWDQVDDEDLKDALGAVSGGFDGPMWMPQLGELSDRRREEELKALRETNPGSSAAPKVIGHLCAITAWGRDVYALTIKRPEGDVVVKLPEHSALYSPLGRIKINARVAIEFAGRADKSKPGQQAPFIYNVRPFNAADCFDRARADALKVIRRDDDPK